MQAAPKQISNKSPHRTARAVPLRVSEAAGRKPSGADQDSIIAPSREFKMKNDDKRKLTPRLRFPEFRDQDGWEEKPLKAICEINPQNGGLPDSFIYIDLESVESGVLNTRKRIEKADAPSRAQRLLRNGDVVFQIVRPYQRNNLFVRFDDNESYVASTGYAQLRAHDCESFLYQSVHAYPFVDRVIAKCTGSSYPAINSSDLAEVCLPVPPSPAEQQKIADCLTSLDEVIVAQGRKVEALKAHKKGLMQQLFPREGETLPRLRFPEFRDALEWKPTSLDELVDIQSGGTPSKANPAFWNGSIPWASAKDMKTLFLEDTEDHISVAAVDNGSRLVPAGTLLMLTRGMTLLKDVPICVIRREMCFNQDVKALQPKVDVDGLFLAFLLLGNKQRLLKMVDIAGHGTGKLNTDELKALELVSPQPSEQQQIADCLSALDARIAAEADKLAALKTHKKGLMQQLFPSPEGMA